MIKLYFSFGWNCPHMLVNYAATFVSSAVSKTKQDCEDKLNLTIFLI